TVTPGNTAPDVSLTTPAIPPLAATCAFAAFGRTKSPAISTRHTQVRPRMQSSFKVEPGLTTDTAPRAAAILALPPNSVNVDAQRALPPVHHPRESRRPPLKILFPWGLLIGAEQEGDEVEILLLAHSSGGAGRHRRAHLVGKLAESASTPARHES